MRPPSVRAAGAKTKARRVAAAVPNPDAMLNGLGPAWRRGVGEAVERAARLTGEDVSRDELRRLVAEQVRRQSASLKVSLDGVTERTRRRVEKIVQTGISKGQRADTIAARMKGTLGKGRAMAVATSETHRASQSAGFGVYEALGVDQKRWATERDDRVRSTHRRMEGQTRFIDQKFRSPSGATADYPGGFGDPAEDANCRCVALPVKGKRATEWTEASIAAEWRRADDALKRFESEALVIVQRAFDAALVRVEDAVRRELA